MITKLDDASVRGMTLEQAISRARGQPDTVVTLTVVRRDDQKARVIKLTRSLIRIRSIDYRLIAPGYAYAHVMQFQEHTPEELVGALESMWKQSRDPVRGLILDLRDDPGGGQHLLQRDRLGREGTPLAIHMAEPPAHDVQPVRDGGERAGIGALENAGLAGEGV